MTQLTPAPSGPARPQRDTRVDIVRGWLQLTIFASHAAGSWIGFWLIYGAWGLSDSSEQFVFLSGFMLGSVFARKAILQGWRPACIDMLWRTARLYRTHLVVFLLFGTLVVMASVTGLFPHEAQRLGWSFALQHPLRAAGAALTMLYQPDYMDILPVFVWCMIVLPVFAAAEARWGDRALLAPLALYLATWLFGLTPPSLAPDTSIGFNPFAWQLLYLLGAWLGRRALLNGQALPPYRWLTVMAVIVVLGGLLLRLAWFGFLPWSAPVGETAAIIGKDDLAWPRVVHALALAWLVACFVPRDAAWMHRAAGRWLASAGRYSLEVFCVGLFLSWGVTVAFRLWPAAVWWLDPLLMVAGCTVLLLVARQLDKRRGERRASVAMASAVRSV